VTNGEATRARVGQLLGLALLAVTLVAPPPPSMSPEAWHAAGVALLMATWWVTEAIPIPATALLPLVLFPLLGVATMADTASPYADPVIFLFMGGFLIAAALQRCGLHLRIALTIISIGGVSPTRLVGAFMVATAFLRCFRLPCRYCCSPPDTATTESPVTPTCQWR
jgi:sodium-dependent dicarboxylate transporter 2/3/5